MSLYADQLESEKSSFGGLADLRVLWAHMGGILIVLG
jgi:hypothetical protein